ncbi:MAG: hypothetical protein M3Q86_09710 [Verrucomicrobiota bacterium]|nr:hypothetical protein [Verrucomicrobiota bacterium]
MAFFRHLISLWTAVLLGAANSHAGPAAFSQDGKLVYLFGSKLPQGTLLEINLASLATKSVSVGVEANLTALCSGRGGLLFVTDNALYQFPLPGGGANKICDAPEGSTLTNVAYDPVKRSILLLGRDATLVDWPAYYLKEGTGTPLRVNCRRVRALTGAVFDRDGHLFFSSGGDFWVGRIDTSGGDDMPPAAVASRFGPVAALETQNTTPASTGVCEIAVAGHTVYGQTVRMGGSGWGSMVSVRWTPPLKKAGADEPDFALPGELKDYVKIYGAALVGFRSYGENARESYLCGSPDGRRVFFATRDRESNKEGTSSIQFYLGDETGNVRLLKGLNVDPEYR